MPKKKIDLSPDEQRQLFEAEIKKQKKAGDFDHITADAALDALVKRQRRQVLPN